MQTVQTTVELPQVQFLDKNVDIHAAGEARTNVKLLGADVPGRSTLICPIRQEDEGRTLRSRGDSHGTSQGQNREELVASHDAVKLLKVEARRANLISMALWQGR